ncbi:hypothetical protein IJI00_00250 [Candidatus Saccharibacteria bacterium]|nr:hypothetical protein [Candidatus Saccharibacteria bacterium]
MNPSYNDSEVSSQAKKVDGGVKRRWGILLGIIIWALSCLGISTEVSAYTYRVGADATLDKIVANNARSCFGALRETVFLEDAIVSSSDTASKLDALFSDVNMTVPMPNTVFNGTAEASPSITCRDLILGNDNWTGLINIGNYYTSWVAQGSGMTPDYTNAVRLLNNLGYEQVAATEQRCFDIAYKSTAYVNANGDAIEYHSNNVCVNLTEDGKVDLESPRGPFAVTGNAGEQGVVIAVSAYDNNRLQLSLRSGASSFGNNGTALISANCGNGACTWEELTKQITDVIDDYVNQPFIINANGGLSITLNETTDTEADSVLAMNTQFEHSSEDQMMTGLTGVTNRGLTDADVFNVYTRYIGNGSYVRFACGEEALFSGSNWKKVRVKRNGAVDDSCYVSETNKQLYTGATKVGGLGYLAVFDSSNLSLDWIVERMNETDISAILDQIDEVVPNQIIDEDAMDGSADELDETSCKDAAGSLGWVLCPIMKMLSGAAEGLYNNTVKPNLAIEPQLFSNNGGGGTKQGWDIFQGIANVLLIVLFLLVIISQLTGYGIDNYGIKRLLPKIILVAILMNLSYYICLILVDVSNIAGNGLQSLFENLPVNEIDSSFNLGSSVGSTLTTVALAGGLGWVASAAGVFSVATLLALLPTLLSVVIGIFFLFIILSARQAAVVVMVVISPLAFACYLLPNTKKMFDKWVKVMEALLVVYPICGLLVAGGDYVSRLLLSTGFANNNFASGIAAMLVGIVPIFFIPMMLRSSMAGLGNLGTRISNFGNRLGSGAAGGLRRSEAFQMAQQKAAERRNMRLSGMRWNSETNAWEQDTSWRGKMRNNLAGSKFGRATGLDRLQGRRRMQAEMARNTAENERDNSRLDVVNAQRARDDAAQDARLGEARAYEEVRKSRTAAAARRARDNEQEAARQDARGRLATQEGRAAEMARVARADFSFERDTAGNNVMEQRARANAGAPKLSVDTLNAMARNTVEMTNAQQRVGVAEINRELADARALASFKAQELRNSADMYGTYTNAQLMAAAGFTQGADGKMQLNAQNVSEMLRQKGGAQRFIALTQAMTSKGLENDMYSVMMNNDVAKALASNPEADMDVRSAFASSPEKLAKAWGKKGAGLSMLKFMTEMETVRDDNGQPLMRDGKEVKMTRLQQYMQGKGAAEFFNGITDKTIGQIAKIQKNTDFNMISTPDLMQGLTMVKEQSAVDAMVDMIKKRGDLSISSDQLTKVVPSVIAGLETTDEGRAALVSASDDLIGDKDRMNKIDKESRKIIDDLRKKAGRKVLVWGNNSNNGGGNNPNNPGDGSPSDGNPTGNAPSGGGSGGTPTGSAPTGSAPTGGAPVGGGGGTTFDSTVPPLGAVPTQDMGQPIFSNSQSVPNMFKNVDADVLLTGVSRVRGTGLPQFNEALLSKPQLNITGDQLAQMDASTINALVNSANPAHQTALIKASDQLINNPTLLAQFKARNPDAVRQINTLRAGGIDPTHVGPRRTL